MKKAIVTGVGGQDGFYMAEILRKKGYEVIGIVHKKDDQLFSDNEIRIIEVDLRKYDDIYMYIKMEQPDEVYNFAAQSSSIYSWEKTRETFELNLMVPVAILESIRDNCPNCRFFQASSAEIYGKEPVECPQNENTAINPATPYATAKSASGMIIKNFREQYGLFVVNGIFYNHESVRRKESFLPAKIVRTVAAIKMGKTDVLTVGNINSKRDWGSAYDYMEAAWEIMQTEDDGDYVFATGIFHTVREMIELAFKTVGVLIIWKGEGIEEVGIDESTGKIVVRVDKKFYRDYDRSNSLGNPERLLTKVRNVNWTSFENMVEKMTYYFIDKEKKNV